MDRVRYVKLSKASEVAGWVKKKHPLFFEYFNATQISKRRKQRVYDCSQCKQRMKQVTNCAFETLSDKQKETITNSIFKIRCALSVQIGCIKLIKCGSEDIYNATKDFCFMFSF